MPMSKYNRYFGGKGGSAGKAKAAMRKQYGASKGESVFYATVNKRRSDHSGGGLQGARQARVDQARKARRRKRK